MTILQRLFRPPYVLPVLLIASILNILPRLSSRTVGADTFIHYLKIEDFASQFWQGDFYPRWRFDAGLGLGSPDLLFEAPLPYIIAALLYPVTWLGLSLPLFYALLQWLATLAAGGTAWLWLKDRLPPGIALLGALLYLWVPYRMETLLFHPSYTELWLIALLPLMLIGIRRILQRGRGGIPGLAALLALGLLCYPPGVVATGIAAGVYALVMRGGVKSLLYLAAAAVLGSGIAAFYLLPAFYYHDLTQPLLTDSPSYGWAHRHPRLDDLASMRLMILAGSGLTVLALIGLGVALWRGRARIDDDFSRQETLAWLGIAGVALFLFLPVSQPLYALLGPFGKAALPWRMQILFIPALAFTASVAMQWVVRRRASWKMDAALLLGLLMLLSYAVAIEWQSPDDIFSQQMRHVRATHRSFTVWEDQALHPPGEGLRRLEEKNRPPQLERVAGEGEAKLLQFDWRGIVIIAETVTPLSLRFDHYYFPIWRVHSDPPADVRLWPELETGRMRLDLPPGNHTVTVYYDVYGGGSLPVRLSPWISFLALLAVTLLRLRMPGRKRFL